MSEPNEIPVEIKEEELNALLKIRREKLADMQAQNADPFRYVKYEVTKHSTEIVENFDTLEGQEVSIAGRMMAKRVMGKASFCHIQDRDGRMQSYVQRDVVGDDPYAEFKRFDIGDIVGIRGEVFRTKTGEISVKAHEVVLLSKSLQILPEKFHGLKDTDMRYRQREVDLIVNPDVKTTFLKRSAVIKSIRAFLDEREYVEVETPVLQTVPGGAAARPFLTHHNSLDLDMHLRISLELPLKRLIIGGLERVYEIGRVFRNEGMSIKHNPEYTLMELYEAYTDYHGMMDLTEAMFRRVAMDVNGSLEIDYFDHKIDLSKPFERLTMVDAVKRYANVDFDAIQTVEEAQAVAKEHHIKFEKWHKKGDILNLFFDEFVEAHLIQPTFLMDHPVDISPLTKRKPDKPEYTERFELYIVGREFGNAYSELNDPVDQRKRFEYQESLRAAGDDEANMIDEEFMLALEHGMPPTGGLGIGIDRMVMLITGAYSIRDVLFFPTMKPLG